MLYMAWNERFFGSVVRKISGGLQGRLGRKSLSTKT